jgi:hypothetical protein
MDMPERKKYILDANCFIEPWNKFYSYDFFDAFWDKFVKGCCDNKIVLIQQEIYDEIMKKSDELNTWVKKHNFEIVKTDLEITRRATKIQNQFPKLAKEITGRSLADPFIIALAQREGATVVTLEDKGTEAKPKIPFVCDALRVKNVSLFSFIKDQGVKFELK